MVFKPETLVADFLKVAALAEAIVPERALSVYTQQAPHRPPSSLPKGKMAVYVFFWRDQCLKVGKVGPNSGARYTSQHYIPSSSSSNLANSVLLGRDALGLSSISDTSVGEWIKTNVDRVNFLLDEGCGVHVLTLLESFLQCRFKPRFEGFKSQR